MPSALATASFAQKRAARCIAGPGAGGRVGALAVGEDPLGQPRPALERALEPLDVEEVDADAAHGGGSYSTVTVLARLRGWSTFSPRSRAM